MSPRGFTSMARTIAIVTLLLACGALQVSCNIAGPLAYVTQPEPTVPAEFELADRPTVVFVDDREGKLVPVGLRDVIAEKISEDLMVRNVVTTAIRPRDAIALVRSRDRNKELLAIDAIGRAVGADQVIYIEISDFAESVDNYQPSPVATAKVKVIDVVEQERLFPANEANAFEYKLVNTQIEEVDRALYRSASTRRAVREMLATQLGGDIGRLFYEHKPVDRLGQRLDAR